MKLARNVGRAYIGVLIVSILIISILVLWFLGREPEKEPASELAIVAQNTIPVLDTDNDGLKDWEEGLWKTDLNNKDTDSDGTTDGEEVHAGRDPLVSGPNDILEKIHATEIAKLSSKNPETTLDTIAQEFLKNFDTLRNPSIPETIKSGVNGAIIEDVQKQTAIKQYGAKDIITNPNTSEEYLRAYGQTVGKILLNNKYFDQQDEPTLVKNLLQTRNETNAQKLTERALIYKKISDELLAVSVPADPSAIRIHLTLLNSYYGMYQSVVGMSMALTDPLAAMISLQRGSYYQSQIVSIYNAMLAVKTRS